MQDHPIERFIDDMVAISIMDMHMYTGLFKSFGGPHDSFMRAPDPDVPAGIEMSSKVDLPAWVHSWLTTVRKQLINSGLDRIAAACDFVIELAATAHALMFPMGSNSKPALVKVFGAASRTLDQ